MPTKTVDLVNSSDTPNVNGKQTVELVNTENLPNNILLGNKSTTYTSVPLEEIVSTPTNFSGNLPGVQANSQTKLTTSSVNTINTNDSTVKLTSNQVTPERSTSLELVNQTEFNFYNEQLTLQKSTVSTQPLITSEVNFTNDVKQVLPTNSNFNQEVFDTTTPVSDILPVFNPEDNFVIGPTNITVTNPDPNADVYIEPTNILQDLGINNTPLIYNTPGFSVGNVIRDILTPGPTNVMVSPPQERRILPEVGITANQLQYDKFGSNTKPRPDLAELEKAKSNTSPAFTGNGGINPFIPAVESSTIAQANFVTGSMGAGEVATAPYFLQSVLATPAGSLPKGALWAVSFESPVGDSTHYRGGIPIGCISQINRYEPSEDWDTTNSLEVLTRESYNGLKGCMFAQSIQTPNESFQAQPDGGIQRNGLIQSYVGQGRNLPSTLKISFLETNVDFVDSIMRPWVIMTGHLGLIARTGDKRYRTNVRFYKIGLTSYGQLPTVLAEYYFTGICPVNVDSTEYTYSSDNPPNRRTVEFIYHYYTVNTSKNTHANITAGAISGPKVNSVFPNSMLA